MRCFVRDSSLRFAALGKTSAHKTQRKTIEVSLFVLFYRFAASGGGEKF
jgi:hypothetical protein